ITDYGSRITDYGSRTTDSSMISRETVWTEIWPVVERLIAATAAADAAAMARELAPEGQAAGLLDLFGPAVFSILLKTVLGRAQLGVARAVETENGRFVHLEFVWPDPAAPDSRYTAADLVSVTLTRPADRWLVFDVNPASLERPLTSLRARGILAAGSRPDDDAPAPPWMLPLALVAGSLQLPPRPEALRDAVEALLLPGLQARGYGAVAQLRGRQMWRDFVAAVSPEVTADRPAAWAAAAEFVIAGQTLREQTQAAAARAYGVNLGSILPRIRQLRQALRLEGVDPRYSDLHATQIVYQT
ncbi:MAG: hypothetical protein KC425_25365, partial [Anaerolineales bacterium]|nr:hypothetical protein [Anaerolineales bacterium]